MKAEDKRGGGGKVTVALCTVMLPSVGLAIRM